MNHDPVVAGGDTGVLDLLAVLETRGSEFDVIGLPREGREAHVHHRRFLAVEGAAEIELSLDPKGVEDLSLVVVEDIDSAVSPVLVARLDLWLERGTKFEVKGEVAKGIERNDPFPEEVSV